MKEPKYIYLLCIFIHNNYFHLLVLTKYTVEQFSTGIWAKYMYDELKEIVHSYGDELYHVCFNFLV